ncbi:MAG: heavy metal-binding domain-containing protein [Betaproteobacteria bacterium]|nr:heavy metal-binding domain-containing protein [Betaproteobacteria bacterium]
MELTTTPSFEGRRVVRYLGIVHGEAIVGANIFRDLLASVRDVVGGRSGAYENVLGDARARSDGAAELGANAVVGSTSTTRRWTGGSMLMVTAAGTAVVVE